MIYNSAFSFTHKETGKRIRKRMCLDQTHMLEKDKIVKLQKSSNDEVL